MTESIFDRLPAPACAELLGWELIAENPEAGTIEIAFHPDARMLNPHGTVQGGFVAAMLDDTMGPALVSMTGGRFVPSSIDLAVSFVRPVKPGRVNRYALAKQQGMDEAVKWTTRFLEVLGEGQCELRPLFEASDFDPEAFPPEAAAREEATRKAMERNAAGR